MAESTRELWDRQRRLVGDREPLFRAVAAAVDASTALYPGSYVDLTPSVVWDDVTYVDTDRRAARFFGDRDGVGEVLAAHDADPDRQRWRFVHADYQERLDVADGSVDLLISLYAGFVSEHCTRYVREGGHLLVNSSHGDAAMASIDGRWLLCGVVTTRSGAYRVRTDELESYLVPTRDVEITRASLHRSGRGVAYTRSPFAYLFERVTGPGTST